MTFVRHGDDPADDLLILINFDPASYERFRIGAPREGDWKLVFNSDESRYGGSDYPMHEMASSEPVAWNGRENSIETPVPGLAGLVFRRVGPSSYIPPKPPKPAARKRSKTPAKASAKASNTSKNKKSQRSRAHKGENA